MKMQFGNNGNFVTDCNSEASKENLSEIKNVMKKVPPFILGVIALVLSIANILSGILINLGGKSIREHLGENAMPWIMLLLTLAIITFLIAVVCGIFTVISHQKTEKTLLGNMGVVFAIISFAVSVAALVYDILGLFVW